MHAMPQCPPVGVIVILTTKGTGAAVYGWFPHVSRSTVGQPTGWLGTNPEYPLVNVYIAMENHNVFNG